MKKLTTTLVAGVSLLGVVAASYGQGEINFANNTSQTPITFGNTVGTSYAADSGQRTFGPASTFEFALYLGPVGATSYQQMTLVDTVYSPNAPTSSGFTAGVDGGVTMTSTTPGTGGNVGGFTAGQTYSDIVLGWTAKDGASFDAAVASGDVNTLTGMSAIGQVTANTPPNGAGQVFGTSGGGEIGTGFTLNAVPEPTTIALSGLGAAALLLFRRRK